MASTESLDLSTIADLQNGAARLALLFKQDGGTGKRRPNSNVLPICLSPGKSNPVHCDVYTITKTETPPDGNVNQHKLSFNKLLSCFLVLLYCSPGVSWQAEGFAMCSCSVDTVV